MPVICRFVVSDVSDVLPLLAGASEDLLSKCDVVRVVPHSNPVVYELGKLVLTNFKICFVRSESNDGVTVSGTCSSIYLLTLIAYESVIFDFCIKQL